MSNPFRDLQDEEDPDVQMVWLINHCIDLEERVQYLETYARALQRNVLTMEIVKTEPTQGGAT